MAENPVSVGSPYFYAGNEAKFYDDTVRMTDRAYDFVHDVTIRVLHFWMLQRASGSVSGAPMSILNVGCGTGAEAMRVLYKLPQCRILCVDNSEEMLDHFRRKIRRAYSDDSADGRLVLAEADFRERGWLDRSLAKFRPGHVGAAFDAVLSVYALHHLSPEVKQQVYRVISERLRTGSLFINADLYTFSTPWLERLAQEEEEDWIRRQFDTTLPSDEWLIAQLGPSGSRLKAAWLAHIRDENLPLPISSRDVEPGHTGPMCCEERLLREAGFTAVDVPARLYQSAVVVAAK